MSEKGALSPRERLFCSAYARLGNGADAAGKAGYAALTRERTALRLLTREDIRQEVARCLEAHRRHSAVMGLVGLERLALGGTGEAAALLAKGEELSPEELRQLDLFGVSQLKSFKGGGVEIKFFDRLRALELLIQQVDKEENTSHSLYQALEQGIQALGDVGPNGDEV